IHARAPYTTHNLVEALLALPIDLKNAMYAEGGHEAQMFVSAGGRQYEYLGGADDGQDDGLASLAWPIPNVIGIVAVSRSRSREPPARRPRSTEPGWPARPRPKRRGDRATGGRNRRGTRPEDSRSRRHVPWPAPQRA